MPCSPISPEVRLSVSTLPFCLMQHLVSGKNQPYFIHSHAMNPEMSLSCFSPHVPVSVTNAFFIKLCFSKYLGTYVFSFLPLPIMSPSLTDYCSLSNCNVLIFCCSPAHFSVFFGHLSKSICSFGMCFLPPFTPPCASQVLCLQKPFPTYTLHVASFPLLFNLEEEN